jgi:hypothetical protein
VSRSIVSTVGLMNSIGFDPESHSEARDPDEFFEFLRDKLRSILAPTYSGGIIEYLFLGVLKARRHNENIISDWRQNVFES